MKDKNKKGSIEYDFCKVVHAVYPCNVCNKTHQVKGSFTKEYMEYWLEKGLDYKEEIRLFLLDYIAGKFNEEHPKDLHMFDQEIVIFMEINGNKTSYF